MNTLDWSFIHEICYSDTLAISASFEDKLAVVRLFPAYLKILYKIFPQLGSRISGIERTTTIDLYVTCFDLSLGKGFFLKRLSQE